MFIRVIKIKFPNELAKKSVIALKSSYKGLLIRLHADISTNSSMIISLWKNKEKFEESRKKCGEKFISEVKELSGIISVSDGNPEVDKAKEIDFFRF